MNEDLIDQVRSSVFTNNGVTISKDDPILLNAFVIKALFQQQIEDTEKITDNIVGANLGKMDESVRVYIKMLEKVNVSYVDNTKLFLKSFEKTIADLQKKEALQWDSISTDVSNKVGKKLNVFLCVQLVLTVAFIAVVLCDKFI